MLEQVNISQASQGAPYPKTPQNPSAFSAGSPALVGVCHGINTHSPEKEDTAWEELLAPELTPGAAVPSPSPHLGQALGDCQGYLRGGHRLTGEGPQRWSTRGAAGEALGSRCSFSQLVHGLQQPAAGECNHLSFVYHLLDIQPQFHFAPFSYRKILRKCPIISPVLLHI